MKYDAEVNQAVAHWASSYGVTIPPALVHAVIQQESSHGAALVSSEPGGRKSYGPMMVLDSTAKDMGVSDPSVLMDPQLGIWYGVRYLGRQLSSFAGDTARAISAYNAGPGNAKRNAAGKFPNQTYVDRVIGYWRLYGGAVASGAAAGIVLVAATIFLLARRRRAA